MIKNAGLAICSALIVMVLATECAVAQAAPTQPDRKARGLIVPENLDALALKQIELNKVSSFLVESVPKRPPACTATQAQFDWRTLQKVTPIQDQGSVCGSCWDFAATAAYESSVLIQNDLPAASIGQVFPHVSEQEGLDCAAPEYSCKGGWPDKVFDYLIQSGETTASRYRSYAAQKLVCANIPPPPREFFALQWGPVDKDNIPSNQAMKTALCEHGPLVVAVNSVHWDDWADNQHYQYSEANPDFLQQFPNGIFVGTPSNPSLVLTSLKPGDVDHEVVIVGWDDNKQSWIIKNSWGTDWGMKGFMLLKYNTANVGFAAAWIRASDSGTPLSSDRLDALKKINAVFKDSKLMIVP